MAGSVDDGSGESPRTRRLSRVLHVALPPLLLLPLLDDHGPGVFLLVGLEIWVVLLCVIVLVVQGIRGELSVRSSLGFVLSPAIVVAMGMLIHGSFRAASEEGWAVAETVHAECMANGRCPDTIPGWDPRSDRFVAETRIGAWLKWPLMYHVDADRRCFDLWQYKLLDTGNAWRGGTCQPLTGPDR